ncbi:MAG: LuxR C-terminal-related transcriptional regulator, partial [Chloroflexota bacterium]
GKECQIFLDTAEWHQWLVAPYRTKFQFKSLWGEFTAYRRRRQDGYHWFAASFVNQRRQEQYLGTPENLTSNWLNNIAKQIGQFSIGMQTTDEDVLDDSEQYAVSELPYPDNTQRTSEVLYPSPKVSQILVTKLMAPRLPETVIARPRLQLLLDRSIHYRLTLVSTAAGYGKTTLVSHWIQSQPTPSAWISLTPQENNLSTFWIYIVEALDIIYPGIRDDVAPFLADNHLVDIQSVILTIINSIANISDDVILVLDNYHHITIEHIHETITFLLQHTPDSFHLMILSRIDPPMPLAYFLGHRYMLNLNTRDLRFTQEEVAIFVSQQPDIDLSAEQIQLLTEHTEGWITGLELTIHTLQRNVDTVEFQYALEQSYHYIFRYFASEVFALQTEHTQLFLLQTAILDNITTAFCENLWTDTMLQEVIPSHSHSAKDSSLLRYLIHHNMFIEQLDTHIGWYRYHSLFGAFLRHHLQIAYADVETWLYIEAAHAYERCQMIDQAIDYFVMARDWDNASRLIKGYTLTILQNGDIVSLLRWLRQLPEEIIQSHTELSILYAWGLFSINQGQSIEQFIYQANYTNHDGDIFRNQDVTLPIHAQETTSNMPPHITAMRSLVAIQHGQMDIALEHIEQVHTLPSDMTLHLILLTTTGESYLAYGRVFEAAQTFRNAINLGQQIGHTFSVLHAQFRLAYAYILQGQLQQTVIICQEALHLAQANTRYHLSPLVGKIYLIFGIVLWEWNDLEVAERYVTQGIELAKQLEDVSTLLLSYAILIRIKQTQGDMDAAHTLLHIAQKLIHVHHPTTIEAVVAETILVRGWLAQGELAYAGHWADTLQSAPAPTRVDVYEFQQMALAKVYIVQQHFAYALTILELLLPNAEKAQRMGQVIHMLTLQAIALQAMGTTDQALQRLEQAMRLAESEGYISIFIDSSRSLSVLVQQLAQQYPNTLYFQHLIEAYTVSDEAQTPSVQNTTLLTSRELDILQLVAVGYSNREIAHHLVLGVETIKWYLKSIYKKLNVHNRVTAVQRAKDIKLLHVS